MTAQLCPYDVVLHNDHALLYCSMFKYPFEAVLKSNLDTLPHSMAVPAQEYLQL
jgi:hypothetical protein